MKTKNLVIIFSLFLLVTLGSGLVIFLNREKIAALDKQPQENKILIPPTPFIKGEPVLDNQPAEQKQEQVIEEKVESKKANQVKTNANIHEKSAPAATDINQEEKIQATLLINGVRYQLNLKPGSSAHDLMVALKEQSKINFQSKNYGDLGFFIEEINGVKNNPGGENWIYYVNGKLAQVGISNYKLKNNDIIEWKYENKTF